jgi:hypothetical protein
LKKIPFDHTPIKNDIANFNGGLVVSGIFYSFANYF